MQVIYIVLLVVSLGMAANALGECGAHLQQTCYYGDTSCKHIMQSESQACILIQMQTSANCCLGSTMCEQTITINGCTIHFKDNELSINGAAGSNILMWPIVFSAVLSLYKTIA